MAVMANSPGVTAQNNAAIANYYANLAKTSSSPVAPQQLATPYVPTQSAPAATLPDVAGVTHLGSAVLNPGAGAPGPNPSDQFIGGLFYFNGNSGVPSEAVSAPTLAGAEALWQSQFGAMFAAPTLPVPYVPPTPAAPAVDPIAAPPAAIVPAAVTNVTGGTTSTAADPNTSATPSASTTGAGLVTTNPADNSALISALTSALTGPSGYGATTVPSTVGALNAAAPTITGTPATTTSSGPNNTEVVLIVVAIVAAIAGYWLYHRWKAKHSGTPAVAHG